MFVMRRLGRSGQARAACSYTRRRHSVLCAPGVVPLNAGGTSKVGLDGLTLATVAAVDRALRPFIGGREGAWSGRSFATPCGEVVPLDVVGNSTPSVRFWLFITRRFPRHRTHSACFVVGLSGTRGRWGSALEQGPRPLQVTAAADTSRAMWLRDEETDRCERYRTESHVMLFIMGHLSVHVVP
jgi:hypothetical protein